MMRSELARTGSLEMSWFHGLSGGKTWYELRMASASGVPKSTGCVIFGMGGRRRAAPGEAAATASRRTHAILFMRILLKIITDLRERRPMGAARHPRGTGPFLAGSYHSRRSDS